MNILGALFQLGDFCWKALQAYVQTPEGAAELYDVLEAWQGDSDPDANNPSQEGQ